MLFLLFLLFSTVLGDVDFTCLPYKIQKDGVFPTGANGLTAFPRDYSCTLQFEIPDGYIVVFQASSKYSDGDFRITDTLGKTYRITGYAQTVYGPARSAKIEITNYYNNQYFVKWDFVQVSSFKKTQVSQGTPVSLELPPRSTWVFSATQGNVQLGMTSSGSRYYSDVQVYSGDSLEGKYLGRLSDLESDDNLIGPGSSLALTTFGNDGASQAGYVIGVDASSVSKYSQYNLVNLDKLFETSQIYIPVNSATTFFSKTGYYDIVSLQPYGVRDTVVKVQPMTPSQGRVALLVYSGSFFKYYMPQRILASVFTVSAANSSAFIAFAPQSQSSWNTGYRLRRGKIISANAWTPGANPSEEDYRIDADYLMTFVYNVDQITLGQQGDQLDVMVGSIGNSTHDYYLENASNTPEKTINGTYLEAKFNANSSQSMFILNFWMSNVFPIPTTTSLPTTTTKTSTVTSTTTRPTTTTISTTTTPPISTTTKPSTTTVTPTIPTSQSSVVTTGTTVGSVTKIPVISTTKSSVRCSGLVVLLVLSLLI